MAVEAYSGAMRIVGPALVIVLIAAAAASAKEIHPGDLRICGATQCHIVTEPRQARAFSSLLWGEAEFRAHPPRGWALPSSRSATRAALPEQSSTRRRFGLQVSTAAAFDAECGIGSRSG